MMLLSAFAVLPVQSYDPVMIGSTVFVHERLGQGLFKGLGKIIAFLDSAGQEIVVEAGESDLDFRHEKVSLPTDVALETSVNQHLKIIDTLPEGHPLVDYAGRAVDGISVDGENFIDLYQSDDFRNKPEVVRALVCETRHIRLLGKEVSMYKTELLGLGGASSIFNRNQFTLSEGSVLRKWNPRPQIPFQRNQEGLDCFATQGPPGLLRESRRASSGLRGSELDGSHVA